MTKRWMPTVYPPIAYNPSTGDTLGIPCGRNRDATPVLLKGDLGYPDDSTHTDPINPGLMGRYLD